MSTTIRIVKTPDAPHGKPRIEGTRIAVFRIGELGRRAGWSVADVSQQFGLDREQTPAALEYDHEHPELIETLPAHHRAGVQAFADATRSD